eukprot:TRINITY_DN1553_c0_g1_i7.p2 TRINITY_DN1553_c0_g1~~TRINITY_DN1553_c0_g1_i7.p2  ORF type:complete len:146 (+),score=6.63 TRINITY_DN1553_c0_g1_i7:301-738(+)
MDAEEVTNVNTQGYDRIHWQVELYRATRFKSYTMGDFTTGFIWQVSEGESFGEKCASDNSDTHGATWSEKGNPVNAKFCYYFDSPIKICKANNLISESLICAWLPTRQTLTVKAWTFWTRASSTSARGRRSPSQAARTESCMEVS